MTSARERVVLPGILCGQGHEVECAVLATKVSLPGTNVFTHCEYSIHSLAKPVPEGRYKLTVNALVFPMRLHNNLWLGDGLN
jgi:hypothetical protein